MSNSFLTPWKYQFDETAQSADNKIENEEHLLASTDHLPFPVNEGLFYTASVQVFRQGNPIPLSVGTDYEFDGLDSYITAKVGHETAAVINIKDKTQTGTYLVTYQAVGGAEGQPMGMVKKLLEAITTATNNNQIDFATNITGLPTYYPPEPHGHPLESMEQLDELAQVFREVNNALINRIPMQDSGNALNQQIDRLLGIIGDLRNSINRVAAVQGAADQIGDVLDQLNNLELAFTSENPVTAGQSTLVAEYDLNEVTSARGFLVFNGITESESVDFSVICRPGETPKTLFYGRHGTGPSNIIEVNATRVNDLLRVSCTCSQGGDVRAKVLAAL